MRDAAAIPKPRAAIAEIEGRKPLNRPQALAVLIDQAGGFIACGCGCGEKLDPLGEGVIDEHVRALGLLGTNELDNRRFYRKPCARRKTLEEDQPRIVKARAQSGESKTAKKKAIPQRVNPWPPAGSQKLKGGRDFPKDARKNRKAQS